jgi:hypothetical protein
MADQHAADSTAADSSHIRTASGDARIPGGAALPFARQFLRQRQAHWAALAGAAPLENALAAALACAARREANSVRHGSYISANRFKCHAATEQGRLALTRQVMERVNPGPFEDPRFLEMLVRQVAPVELTLGPDSGPDLGAPLPS